MAYIPPHKRHLKDSDTAAPSPALLGSPKSSSDKGRLRQICKPPRMTFKYADNAVSRWFAVGSMSDDLLPVSLELVPLGFLKFGKTPLVLLNNDVENMSEVADSSKSPWIAIAENVVEDLLSSFQALRREIESDNSVKVKPDLVARFGTVMFFDRPRSFDTKTTGHKVLLQSTLRILKKTFDTNLPASYLDNVTSVTAREIGLDAEEQKETYLVKLYNKDQPDATIVCKCKATSDGQRLKLYKLELNHVRHTVADISCLAKKLDLRLMLFTKKIIANIRDDEKESIERLINSAVLDSEVKGGLRWPLGKDCSADCGFHVVGVAHIKSESFRNLNFTLKVCCADRFDFESSIGGVSREVFLKLTESFSTLKEPNVDTSSLLKVLSDSLKVVWNYFLNCDNFLNLDSTSSS